MKALLLEAPGRLVYRDVPAPEPAPNEVLVAVRACGICGSDVHGLDGSTGRRIPPLIMGHEAAGVIAATGADVTHWKAGDRVTFDSTIYQLDDWFTRRGLPNLSDGRMVLGVAPGDYRRDGCFAEFVAVPQHILYAIPDGVSFEQAALVEPVAVALHALRLVPIESGDVALVMGAGMIGICLVQALRAAGCSCVAVADLDPIRLERAVALGASLPLRTDQADVPAELRRLTDGRGADAAYEAVGIAATVGIAIDSVRRGGAVALVGNVSPTVELPLQTVVTRQLRLQGSCAVCGEYPAALDLIARGAIDVASLVSGVAPLADGAAWFERLARREPGLLKVLLTP